MRDTENTDYDTVHYNIIGARNILININLTNTQEITIYQSVEESLVEPSEKLYDPFRTSSIAPALTSPAFTTQFIHLTSISPGSKICQFINTIFGFIFRCPSLAAPSSAAPSPADTATSSSPPPESLSAPPSYTPPSPAATSASTPPPLSATAPVRSIVWKEVGGVHSKIHGSKSWRKRICRWWREQSRPGFYLLINAHSKIQHERSCPIERKSNWIQFAFLITEGITCFNYQIKHAAAEICHLNSIWWWKGSFTQCFPDKK